MGQKKTINYVYKLDAYSSHSIILSWLETFPIGTKILDIGTATGIVGKMLTHKKFQLFGLEPETEWLESAKSYYEEILNCTLGNAPSSYLSCYDVIILADVLEHMANPDNELKRLLSLQKKETICIISVPNIANIWIRFSLLFGNFNYTNRGILDKTHLRFFTKKSFQRFVEIQGLHIIQMDVSPIPLELISSFFRTTWLGKFISKHFLILAKLFPTLFGYQFVAKCEVYKNGKH